MRLKKAFAVILAIAMVFGAVSLASAATPVAAGFADAAENKQADQIAYLQALGIAKGDENGNFNPDAALTRQEFVTFVARLAGQEEAAEFMAGIPSRYLDDENISDWARGPVNLADTNGWVQGYDDGLFHPTDTLTYAQAVTVLIRVLGHEAVVTGAWPNAHIVKGINLGLNAGVSLSANTPISRADMGRLLFNALFIDQLEATGDGKWQAGDSLMAGRTAEGTVTGVSTTNITIRKSDDTSITRTFADDVSIVGKASSFAALQGLSVRITSSNIGNANAKVTVVEVRNAQTSAVLVVDEVKVVNDASTGFEAKNFIFFTDESRVEYNGDTTYSVNGSGTVKNGGAYGAGNAPTVAAVLEEGDWVVVSESSGVAKHLQITSWDLAADLDDILTEDGVAQTKSDNKDAIEGDAAGTVATKGANITLNGEGAKVTDLKKGDVVSIAYKLSWEVIDDNGTPNDLDDDDWDFVEVDDADNDLVAFRVVAVRNTVSGTVKSARTTTKVGGTATIEVTLTLADNSTKTVTLAGAAAALGAPDEGIKITYALNADGKAFYVVGAESLNNLVKLVSIVNGNTLIVDRNGTEISYGLSGGGNDPDATDLGLVGFITVVNGKVTDFDAVTVRVTGGNADEFKIAGVDTANGFVILEGGEALKADALYKASFATVTGRAGAALTLSDLAKGNTVYVGEVTVGGNDYVAIFKK